MLNDKQKHITYTFHFIDDRVAFLYCFDMLANPVNCIIPRFVLYIWNIAFEVKS